MAESLARTGARRFWLADFDAIRESNLNRHPFAFRSTLGMAKTAVAERFLRDIRGEGAEVDARELFLDGDTAEAWLREARPDVLVDAIDSLLPKTELLLAAGRSGVPRILSCMGAARKRDPSRFRATPLEESRVCPLAQLVRKRLRKRGWVEGIWAVWSDEPPGPPDGEPPEEGDLTDRGRRRAPMGSLHACTSAAAAVAAARVVSWIQEGRGGLSE